MSEVQIDVNIITKLEKKYYTINDANRLKKRIFYFLINDVNEF